MESQIYKINDIMRILPHRYPFLLVDQIEVINKGEEGIGYKNVTMNEPFFQGHFPDNPIMPGVLQIEAMAQTAGFIIATGFEQDKKANVLFMGVDKVKFRHQVIPGDRLEIHAIRRIAMFLFARQRLMWAKTLFVRQFLRQWLTKKIYQKTY